MENTEHLKSLLNNGIVNVVFLKKDGTEREMRCTLKNDIIPPGLPLNDKVNTRKQNDEVLPVWDVDNAGWRSFRLDSVIVYNLD